MSIKRTKQRTYRRGDEDVTSFTFSKPAEPEKTWEEHMVGQPDEVFLLYSLQASLGKVGLQKGHVELAAVKGHQERKLRDVNGELVQVDPVDEEAQPPATQGTDHRHFVVVSR